MGDRTIKPDDGAEINMSAGEIISRERRRAFEAAMMQDKISAALRFLSSAIRIIAYFGNIRMAVEDSDFDRRSLFLFGRLCLP